MKNLTKINIGLGWTLVIGMLITQLAITQAALRIGYMAPFFALLLAVVFFPFFITAIASVLNREQHLTKIRVGIGIGLLFQVGLPVLLPFFFDKEFIYLSLAGFLLGVIMWYFRKKIEIQLLILNGIGLILWTFVSLSALLSS